MTDEERVMKKDQLYSDYAVKSERMHTLQQLLKAYTMVQPATMNMSSSTAK